MIYQIQHSGRTWTSLGNGPTGLALWPIEEMFARSKFSSTVRERIRKFYPNGKEEGSLIRGYYREPMSWRQAKKKIARGDRVYWFRRKGNRGDWSSLLYNGLPPECSA